jgi:hypothetical protein
MSQIRLAHGSGSRGLVCGSIHVCMYVHARACKYVYMCVHVCVLGCVCMQVCMHARVRKCYIYVWGCECLDGPGLFLLEDCGGWFVALGMYVRIYACAVCVCVCTYKCMQCTYICMNCVCVYVYMHACMSLYSYLIIIYTHTLYATGLHRWDIKIRACTCICTYAYIRTHAYIHTYILRYIP